MERVIENGQVWLIGCDAARLSASKVQKLAEHAALNCLLAHHGQFAFSIALGNGG